MDNILIVEDDRDIQELLRYHLEKHGYAPEIIANGAAAQAAAKKNRPALILLDLMLPGLDGLEVCRALKTDPATAAIPIIMVTARDDEADIVTGLELGAIDYVTKPFRPRELIARVKSALRRTDASSASPDTADTETLAHRNIRLDSARRAVYIDNAPVELTAGEFELLRFLMRRPGRVFTRDQIIDAVRGDDYAVTDRAVDVQIVGLRRKLGLAGAHIETVRGVGYRMSDGD